MKYEVTLTRTDKLTAEISAETPGEAEDIALDGFLKGELRFENDGFRRVSAKADSVSESLDADEEAEDTATGPQEMYRMELSEKDLSSLYRVFSDAYHAISTNYVFYSQRITAKYEDGMPPARSEDWNKLSEMLRVSNAKEKSIKSLWAKLVPEDADNIDNVFG